MEINVPKNPEICPNCYVGRISRQTRSLVMMDGDTPVTFPFFPAWTCDVCNAFVYDPVAIVNLRALLKSTKRTTTEFIERKPIVKRRKLNKASKPKTIDQK